MPKLNTLLAGLAALVVTFVSGNAQAVILNLDPANLNDDTGIGTFRPVGVSGSGISASLELYDPLSPLTSFGFYFLGDSGNRVTIFDNLDVTPPQGAAIDFNSGLVADLDAGVLQDTFAPSFNDVGFWLDVAGNVIFTQAALNPGGVDLSGTYTVKADPTAQVVSFEYDNTVFSVNLVGGFIAVPEPSTLVLMAAGLMLLATAGRSVTRRAAAGRRDA